MENKYLEIAIKQAKKAYKKNEIPVGCVIVKNDTIISYGYNCKEKRKKATMHAEIVAINRACKKLKSWRLDDCVLYVTLEPCMMCLGAIFESRIKYVYFGTKYKGKQMFDLGECHNITFIDLKNKECAKLLTNFFANKRKK